MLNRTFIVVWDDVDITLANSKHQCSLNNNVCWRCWTYKTLCQLLHTPTARMRTLLHARAYLPAIVFFPHSGVYAPPTPHLLYPFIYRATRTSHASLPFILACQRYTCRLLRRAATPRAMRAYCNCLYILTTPAATLPVTRAHRCYPCATCLRAAASTSAHPTCYTCLASPPHAYRCRPPTHHTTPFPTY